MTKLLKKIKLKGNESFNIREGWLRKGMRNVSQYPNLFTREDVMEILGVGSKMVKAIRFWLKAANLCYESNTGGNRSREIKFTDDFGTIIYNYDPYFEDPFTLSLIHYQIVANTQGMCPIWSIFFNEYDADIFCRDDMYESCETLLQKKLESGATYSQKSLQDDCSSIIRMYLESDNIEDPESNLGSPLSELKLIKKNNKGYFYKSAPNHDVLNLFAVFYVILQNIEPEKDSISMIDLWRAPNNIGRVFNLSRASINDYLDQLKAMNYITINRTAGLDMIYLNSEITPSDIMIEYYKKAQER